MDFIRDLTHEIINELIKDNIIDEVIKQVIHEVLVHVCLPCACSSANCWAIHGTPNTPRTPRNNKKARPSANAISSTMPRRILSPRAAAMADVSHTWPTLRVAAWAGSHRGGQVREAGLARASGPLEEG